MRVGMVGCGKLGLMVALAIESKGHQVKGYDISDEPGLALSRRKLSFKEEGSEELLANTEMTMVGLKELCEWSEILFLAPQTPHEPQYEGTTLLPSTRVDFDYSHLKRCVQDVNECILYNDGTHRLKAIVIISTVLPGTLEREVTPLVSRSFLRYLVYEPLFIAMGTVLHDFLNPEFVLVGHDECTEWGFDTAPIWLEKFYETIHDKTVFRTNIRTAEGIKVFYNTFITTKTVLANLYGEMAEKLGMNVDDIFSALSLATDRLISPKYLKAGMGDGGGCHPRDNIALSFLARKVDLSFDFFESLMEAREGHVFWLVDLIKEHRGNLPVHILGRAFKPETNIETGSPALLLSSILRDAGISHSHEEDIYPRDKGLFFIGTRHERYKRYKFPAGSVVIDPFRYIPEQPHVSILRIGGKSSLDLKKKDVLIPV